MPTFIDSHCHLDDPRFDDDREAVCRRADKAGVKAIVVPAISRENWPRTQATTSRYPHAFAAYGLHPMFMAQHRDSDLDALESWLQRESPVAVGECGLDFYSDRETRQQQLDLFDAQLALARRHHLPVIVHARKSVEDAIALIRRHPGVRGVFHSYSGSYEQARRLLDLGFMFGIGGPYTWERSRRLHALLPRLPLDSLLLETDAPDQPDERHRGQRNEPAFVRDIATVIAARLDVSLERLAAATSANAISLFSLPFSG